MKIIALLINFLLYLNLLNFYFLIKKEYEDIASLIFANISVIFLNYIMVYSILLNLRGWDNEKYWLVNSCRLYIILYNYFNLFDIITWQDTIYLIYLI